MFVIAQLRGEQVDQLQRFEQTKGIKVLALAEMKVNPAPLDAEGLEELRKLEEELGVCLLAVA